MGGTCSIDGCTGAVIARGWCFKHYLRWRKHGDPAVVANWRGMPLAERFRRSVSIGAPDECWEWQRSRVHGYGRIMVDGRIVGAHRASYILHKGPIPDGLHVRHTCDNPPCVNPAHLILGTNADNVADKVARRRTRTRIPDQVIADIRSDPRAATEIASDLGVSVGHVRDVRAGRARRSA